MTDIYTSWANNECANCHAGLSQSGDGNHKSCTACDRTYERVVAPGLNEYIVTYSPDGIQVAS